MFYTKGKTRLTGKHNERNHLSEFLSFVIQENLIFFWLGSGNFMEGKKLRMAKDKLAQPSGQFVREAGKL